jgi:hypothetical protein
VPSNLKCRVDNHINHNIKRILTAVRNCIVVC